jgi:hypothetical protein
MRWGWYIEDEELSALESASGSIAGAADMVTYVVFWLDDGEAKAKKAYGLTAMLMECEQLRKLQREGDKKISHIASCVDELIQVGHPGVDVTGPDYDWKKRRT